MLILSILTNFILANNSETETEKSYLMFILRLILKRVHIFKINTALV